MDAFAMTVDQLFSDPNLARDAWHRDSEGIFTGIRIIPRAEDVTRGFGGARLWSESFRFDVRVSDLPSPRPDEQILFGEETYLIQGEPVRDRDRLIWTIEATPA